ncbi:MAG: multicopper oxidase domain-containing protein [Lautropia sp.]|nr:multicopper oxidase domain-containing protein [Lautropia sp.]
MTKTCFSPPTREPWSARQSTRFDDTDTAPNSVPTAIGLTLAAIMLAQAPGVQAQASVETYTTFSNPPVFNARDELSNIDVPNRKPPGVLSPRPGASTQGLLRPDDIPPNTSIRLNVGYVNSYIWNPFSGRAEAVKLRGYYESDLVAAPAIEVRPGQRLNIQLNNQLPEDPSCPEDNPRNEGHEPTAHEAGHDHNTPHCFNTTNLHTHGLWVSPNEDADNVFLKIKPGKSQPYKIDIPRDHPAGTFWYHSHVHGSTALQVSSGMAGPLIIRGTRQPTHTQPGDLDTLLRSTTAHSVNERIMLFQQIQYACRDENGQIKQNPDKTWRCDEGDVGELEQYDGVLDFGRWPESGRLTTINGKTAPRLTSVAGRLERWRMIHAGVRETINLQIRRAPNLELATGFGHDTTRMSAAQMHRIIQDVCTGEPLQYHLTAADGLTMNAMQAKTQTVFQPGYRWDAMMVFPKAGYYCLIDEAMPAGGSVDNASARQLLGIVEVRPGTEVDENQIGEHLKQRLVELAQENVAADMRDEVIAELRASLGTSKYAPHKSLANDTMTGPGQTVVFNVTPAANGEPARFEVNGNPYDGKTSRMLRLGDTEEWLLKSDRFGHPFHIHVNPFQIISIQDRHGRELSGDDIPDDDNGALPVDPQFRGLKNVWKDTLFVKSAPGDDLSQGQYQIRVRTRYQHFTGKFVLHCHILDHEDRGMMEDVEIQAQKPDEAPLKPEPVPAEPSPVVPRPAPGIPIPSLPKT